MTKPNILLSNFINDAWIDRVYQDLQGKLYLKRPSGETVDCKLKTIKKRYMLASTGQWFNSSGLPIDPPQDVNVTEELATLKKEMKQADQDAKFNALKAKIISGK